MLYLKIFTLVISALVLSTDLVQSKYVQHKIVATWEEAKHQCEKEGAILASPVDATFLQDMISLVGKNQHTNSYFIGTTARYNPELQFVSLEGVLLDNAPAMDLVDRLDPRDGDCLAMNRERIYVVPCWERLPYICYKNETAPTPPTPTTPTTLQTIPTLPTLSDLPTLTNLTIAAICGIGGYELSPTGGCHKYNDKRSTWADANAACILSGGYLAILNDEDEAKTITQLIIKSGNRPGAWVGLRDTTNHGDWRSVHGHTLDQVYNVWRRFGKYDISKEACGYMEGGKNAKLSEYLCQNHLAFICEKDVIIGIHPFYKLLFKLQCTCM